MYLVEIMDDTITSSEIVKWMYLQYKAKIVADG